MKKYKNPIGRLQVLLLLVSLVLSISAVDLPALVKQVGQSVVTINAYDDDGQMSLGTGWMISDTRIVTCYHVIEDTRRIEAVFRDHRKVQVTGVAAADEHGDIAILIVPKQKNIKPLAVAGGLPQVGERIFVIGSPLGLEATVSEGIVSSIRPINGVNFVQFTAPISQGSSGSPVLNEKGEVVAVVDMMLKEGQGLNFAVEAGRVAKAHSRPAQPQPSIRPETPPPGPRSQNGKITERAKGDNRKPPEDRPEPQQPRPQTPPPANNGKTYELK